jgi:hypothetical protein
MNELNSSYKSTNYDLLRNLRLGADISVETITDRNNIFLHRRKWGTIVHVFNDPTPDNNGFYFLQYGFVNTQLRDNANWARIEVPEEDPIFTAHTTFNITDGDGLLTNDGDGNWSYTKKLWNLRVNTETVGADVSLGDIVYFRPGANITITRNGRIVSIASSVEIPDPELYDHNLTDHLDVTIDSPITGETLVYDGSEWVNSVNSKVFTFNNTDSWTTTGAGHYIDFHHDLNSKVVTEVRDTSHKKVFVDSFRVDDNTEKLYVPPGYRFAGVIRITK